MWNEIDGKYRCELVMIEYPEIINSSKAPRLACIAFDKLDGSNIRIKWTQKRGFDLFHEFYERKNS